MSRVTWQDLKLTGQFVKAVLEQGFVTPSLIQEKCILPIMAGQKVIGIAQTGTGKTAAYLLPLLMKLKFAQGTHPRTLVLAPTKELVIQIGAHCKLLSKYTDLRTVELYGGVGPKSQVNRLNEGADIIIATPGRFLELYNLRAIATKQLKNLVIDEADRMMDMNFMPQIRKILEVLPPKRQDLLFSATFPPKVDKMVNEFIDFPHKIEVTPQSSVTGQVQQSLYLTPNFRTKLNLLLRLFESPEFLRVIIFCRTKETVISLAKFLDRSGTGTIKAIHSNKSQNARINAMREYGEGLVRTLIATDVAARGIDIKNVTHVINFDVPLIYEEYIHRIGRTGRAQSKGEAITFVTPSDVYHIGKIESITGERISQLSLPSGVLVKETPFLESQKIARELDRQKRKTDPTFKGAFHERKK